MHVIVRNGNVVDIEPIHNSQPSEFADQAMSYMRSLHLRSPRGSAVTELHLEVKMRRKLQTP